MKGSKETMQKFVDIKELAEILSVKTSTIYSWVHEDSIPYYKINRLVRFNLSEIMEWLNKKNKNKPLLRRNS